MAVISQTIFSDAFSRKKGFVFWLKFHWSLFLRVQLTISQYGLDNGLAPNHYLNQCLSDPLRHICGTWGRWVNKMVVLFRHYGSERFVTWHCRFWSYFQTKDLLANYTCQTTYYDLCLSVSIDLLLDHNYPSHKMGVANLPVALDPLSI